MTENYVIVSAKTFDEARKEIRKNEGKKIIFSGNDDELNRKILEKEKISVLLLSQAGRKDRLKQKDSGLNEVLAKIAKKENIAVGINLDEIINSGKEQKAKILARAEQNIRLCRKNKVAIKFVSEKKHDPYNLKSLGLVLGMPTWMTKEL